jgi:hypothetical protein
VETSLRELLIKFKIKQAITTRHPKYEQILQRMFGEVMDGERAKGLASTRPLP